MPPPQHPAAAAPTAEDPLVFQLLTEVGIIDQLAQSLGARLLAPDLNLPQFAVLNHFARLGGEQSLVQLAGAMQVTKAAMTNTITRLQAKGLVEVRPDPLDGRGKRVGLSAAGLAARQQALARLAPGLAGLAQTVPATDLAAALPVLRALRGWLDSHR